MKVVCAPNPDIIASDADLSFALLQTPSNVAHNRVGVQLPYDIRRFGIVPHAAAWDFMAIALAAIAADHGCLRSSSPDGWTRVIELHVALVEPETWEPHIERVAQALRFLTGDVWNIVLHSGGQSPLPRTWRVRAPLLEGDTVCLLSGGVDSLVGALDITRSGKTPVFVSQVVKGDAELQQTFARAMGSTLRHVQLSHATTVSGTAELSQRARSINFVAFGLLAASCLPAHFEGIELIVPENGFISFNVPLTPLRIGSHSTRTAHPFFLKQIQGVWNDVGLNVAISNPYQYQTKGEMLVGCRDQDLLNEHVFDSTSCARFGRHGYNHCGRCVPCLVRRAAFKRWGVDDQTPYKYEDLRAESDFDDVRSVAIACERVQALGIERWCGSAISYQQVDDVPAAYQLIERGIDELRVLLSQSGVL